jgi:phosphoribosylformimino-5-aminoimidazole carboxamide ribotide isomerase
LVEQIAKRLPVQAGGGIHTIERARQVLDAGARRVIIGSALFSAEGTVNTEFAAKMAESVGAERVVAGIDTKNGRIAVKGWKAQVELTPDEAIPAARAARGGVSLHACGHRRNDAGISQSTWPRGCAG